ncbi:MAG: zinc-binding dehydrogenase, partial [Candidatus Thiodiazotropha sp. (ex Lucinoma kastoroae)]|nr:zinc-binding dehydrogenase [Candidatus Thiodiazotropha sp. (ex Lucinoma kastoroae)]
FRESIYVTSHYGDLVTLLDPGLDVDWKEARNRNLRISFTLMLTPMLRSLPQARANQAAILSDCAEMIDNGSLKVSISECLPLAQAAKAHRIIEEGHAQGKLILEM